MLQIKHKSFYIKLIICLFIFFIPLFIILSHVKPTARSSYHAKLLARMEQENDFQNFLNTFFCYHVTTDSITTTYMLKEPSSYNIPTLEPKLTSFSYQDYAKQYKNKQPEKTTEFILDCLHRFSKQKLSKDEQLTCTLLTDYLNTNANLSQYPFYEELLGSSSGIQANLPVTLGEYPLRQEADVKTYLHLLQQLPAYTDDVISYEEHRKKIGYETPSFVTAQALNSTKTMLAGFKKEDNSFIDTFNERIIQIDTLSKKEIRSYKQTNKEYVEKYVVPSYEKIIIYLENVLADSKIDPSTKQTSSTSITDINKSYGICTLPEGKTYYTYLAQYSTGSNKTVEEMISKTDQALSDATETVLHTALTNQEAYLYYCEHPLESYYESPEAMLDTLSLMIRDQYPALKNIPFYKVKMVSDSLADSLSPAFYMIPAIDDYKNNTIYINPLHTNEENGTLFPTLAHEGFPGHLYQTVYFNESNPSAVRHLLDYLGYVEGWATYVEINSLNYLKYPLEGDALCKLYQAESIMNLALCARIDMGVNYEGWALSDTKKFFEEQGFTSEYAEDVYSYVVEAPANYLSYFIGYLEILEIKDSYKRQEAENYSELEFHKRFLDVGPADFETVKKYVLDK